MKKALALLLLLISVSNINAQKSDTVKTIPHYKLLTKDSTYVTDANLKKGKPTMIIYFSPDCTHCQHLTFEMQDEFKKEAKAGTHTLAHVQIVMATWTMLKSIQVFYNEFGLVKYPNITVGTEGYAMTLQKYYNVRTTPYIAIYSKNGQLVKFFDKVPTMEDIVDALKKV
jgi:thioredoxin-related protein